MKYKKDSESHEFVVTLSFLIMPFYKYFSTAAINSPFGIAPITFCTTSPSL